MASVVPSPHATPQKAARDRAARNEHLPQMLKLGTRRLSAIRLVQGFSRMYHVEAFKKMKPPGLNRPAASQSTFTEQRRKLGKYPTLNRLARIATKAVR
jgi:hypothetical protein